MIEEIIDAVSTMVLKQQIEKSNFIGVRGSLKKVGETTCEKKPEEQGTMGVRQGTGKGENISQGHLNIE